MSESKTNAPDPHKEAGVLFRNGFTGELPPLKRMVKYLRLFGATHIRLTLTIQLNNGSKSNHVIELLKPETKNVKG